MSLQLQDLSVLAYANNFTLWHYKTADTDITTAGYFNIAQDMMNENDLVIAATDIDGTAVMQFYTVTDVTNGVVTITAYS